MQRGPWNTKRLPLYSVHALALAISGAAFSSTATAQNQTGAAAATSADTDQEIVITAQRREERALDVPISVQTINADQLAKNGVDDVLDVVSLTPSLRIDYRL